MVPLPGFATVSKPSHADAYLHLHSESRSLTEPQTPNIDDEDITTEETDDDGSDVVDQVIADFLERTKGQGPPDISSGILALDRAIISLRPKKMMVVAARPGMGKTALAATIRRAVLKQNYVVLDFNLEMGAEELGERELSYNAQINLRKVMAAKEVTADEMRRVMESLGTVPKGLWWVYDTCFSMLEIVRKCRLAKKRANREGKKIGLVVIDYLQLLGDVGTEGRQQSVSACSRMTKLLAKEMDCTVLALSQLNRNCEYRDDKRPMMADIRESGSIEQDADIIMFVYRDWVYNPTTDPTKAELIIRKNRAGPLGTVIARFNSRTTHFDDMPPPPPGNQETMQ